MHFRMLTPRRLFGLFTLVLLVVSACQPLAQSPGSSIPDGFEIYSETGNVPRRDNAIDVSIVYSPESQQYMPEIIRRFNQLYADGTNPVSGAVLAQNEAPVYVWGTDPLRGSSGTAMQGIVNAIIAPNNDNLYRPVIFQPSVSHWLALANYYSSRPLFDVSQSSATALSPVIIGIWESRLEALQNTLGTTEIGLEDLLQVLNSPNGWQDFGIPNGRRAVFYGHTDPTQSSTGLSATIAEFYACARANNFTDRRLSREAIDNAAVQECVRNIEQLVRHYSRRTEDFLEYMARGPEYLDFLALEETDLICLNLGAQQGDETCTKPEERLVAIYPKEGTFWHEHPMGIVNAEWVSEGQREAARTFIDFVLLAEQQRYIMSFGFRPANPDVPLDYPFVEENGVDPTQPTVILDVPAPEVIVGIQQSWSLVRKQADILLVIDTSGSMASDDKIGQAQAAALEFIGSMEATNRVGLATFDDEIEIRVPIDDFEQVQDQLYSHIRSLRADGGTELYGALDASVELMNAQSDDNRIRAVVLLSDGADTGDIGITLNDVVNAIEASADEVNPVIVIPVAYGGDADVQTLNAIARASATRVQSGDAENIRQILELISSYF
jgi:Ca-activated chloride channel homolog